MVTLCALIPAYASGEVRITLKNGRSLVADSCKEVNGRLLCKMREGTMEIPLQDVAGTKEVKGGTGRSEQRFETGDTGEERESPEGSAGQKKVVPLPGGSGEPLNGLSPEQSKRLAEINQRKAELNLERENLIRDRERLYEDIKKTGVVRTQEQFDAIKKRISELESRIIRLNDEVKKLNDEESMMFEGNKIPRK